MRKYNLSIINQNNKQFYSLVADPRIIVKLLKKYEAGAIQENQRPWEEKRVKEIACYVKNGLIPNAPILNITNKLKIEKDGENVYIMLPETKNEFEEYEETLEAIDGQHRIRAFMEEYNEINPTTKFELIFTLFDRLSGEEKKKTFMTTNEKQKSVPINLLRLYKKELKLMDGENAEVFDLTKALNEEDYSPLKGRIMMGAEKIKKGYQESQISKIIKKYDVYKTLKNIPNESKRPKIISNYLKAWENYYSESFANPGKNTLTKISGIRFELTMLPYMINILCDIKGESYTEENFKKLIADLRDANSGMDVFNPAEEDRNTISEKFRGESTTVSFAQSMAENLKEYERKHAKEAFDPTAGI